MITSLVPAHSLPFTRKIKIAKGCFWVTEKGDFNSGITFSID